MDALKHKVHTAYKVRMPDRSSLQTPISLPPAARPSIFSVSFQMGWGARYALLTHPRTALSPPSTQGVAESLMTTRTTSAFLEKGVVTPEEFVVAGDYLVAQCPTWSWQGGDPKSAKSYLPDDKQFLVTRNVPCLKRARAMEEYAGKETHLSGEDEGWVAAGGDGNGGEGGTKDEDAPDMDDVANDISNLKVGADDGEAKPDDAAAADDDDAIPDMDDFDMCGDDEEDDASALRPSNAASAGGTRRILRRTPHTSSRPEHTTSQSHSTSTTKPRGCGSTATTSHARRWIPRRRSRTSQRSTRGRR